ncbi:DNA-processing protein DprA [Leifsonia sp. LS-T14]|uniref:DNA-processing protein DprA n=1 Tax=unclassified Leifsonia TaxID=2663824 RepID=UPI0035A60FB4
MSGQELDRLLGPVLVADGSENTSEAGSALAEDRFARAALGTAIEPGDLEAGRLVSALGPVRLLHAIVDGVDAAGLLAEVRSRDQGDEGLARLPSSWEEQSSNDRDTAAALERRVATALARWRPRLSFAESARSIERAARIGARLLTPDSRWWPAGFAGLDDGPPLALWIRGHARHFGRLGRSLALVGARASTEYGEHVAMESAAGLSDRGFVIVSGGAYGIDAAAHRATLASGGVTIAFLAGGADRLYPAGNTELLRRIASEGVVVAELPPGSAPTRWRFLMRNRLIAAAATATVVVEAGHRSGSLNTAGHAAHMGRPLGAVPGSVLSPASAGCHRLIREYAATCVTTPDEMAELADPFGSGNPPPDPATPFALVREGGDGDERAVLSALSRVRSESADEIAARVALPFTRVAAVLGRLDLADRARESAEGGP